MMPPIAALFITGVLFLAALLGLPLISLAAGAAAALWLAPRTLPFAIAALAVALLAEFLAIRLTPPRDPALAQAGALLVLGRILGAAAGAGTWSAAVAGGLDPRLALRDFAARGTRAAGVLLVLAAVALAG